MRRLLMVFALVGIAVACNSADFTPATPKDCKKVACDCEEDPAQPTCRGFNGQPDGGLDGATTDSATLDAELDTGVDADIDAGDDAADAGDQ